MYWISYIIYTVHSIQCKGNTNKHFTWKIKKRIVGTCLLLIAAYFVFTWWIDTRYERELDKFRKAGVPTSYAEAFPNEPVIHELDNAYHEAKIITDLMNDPKDGSDLRMITEMVYAREPISSRTRRNLPLEDFHEKYEKDFRLLNDQGKTQIEVILEN